MKEILFALNNIGYGGASKITVWLMHHLQKVGYKVSVIAYTSECSRDIPEGVNVIKIIHSNNSVARNSLDVFVHAKVIRSYILKNKPELVISYGDHLLYALVLVKLFYNFNLLVSERTDPYSPKGFSDKFRRFLYRFGDAFVFQTNEAQSYFPEKIRSASRVIYNPVMKCIKSKIWNLENTSKAIINVGRLDIRQKRQDVMLKAFAIFVKQHPDYQLWLVGDGVERKELEEITQQQGISDNVRFLGFRSDVDALLAKARLFVLSSDYEGIPNSMIEALQCGIPVVSTDCSPGGAKLLLNNGRHGRIVPRENVIALSQAMNEVVNSDKSLSDASNSTRGALERFDENIIAEQWVEYINQFLKC